MIRRACMLALAAVLLAGCSPVVTAPAPQRHFYALIAKRPGLTPSSGDKTVLKVRPIQISPAFQGKEMVYRLDDVEYESDYYNAFFVQPASAVSQAVEDWLGRSGVFGHVVDSTSQMQDTHTLEGMVNALYGDFRDRRNPVAVLEMQFFLLRNRDEKFSVVFQKTYTRNVAFPPVKSNAANLAQAYQQGLAEILAELEKDLRSAR